MKKVNERPLPPHLERNLHDLAVLYAAVAFNRPSIDTYEAMAEETGYDEDLVRRGIKSAVQNGLVRQQKGGEYRISLTEAGHETLAQLTVTNVNT